MKAQPNIPSIDERIAAAFLDGVQSADVADLICEAEAAAILSADAAERAREKALHPALSAPDVAAARRDMQDADFRRDRMKEAVRRLGERLRELKEQEEQARRRAAYDAALAERDTLAAELVEVYPAVTEKLACLAARVAANDAAIERVNQKLPHGATSMAGAELVARGLASFIADGISNVPRITKHMRLPAFLYSGRDPYAWPRT